LPTEATLVGASNDLESRPKIKKPSYDIRGEALNKRASIEFPQPDGNLKVSKLSLDDEDEEIPSASDEICLDVTPFDIEDENGKKYSEKDVTMIFWFLFIMDILLNVDHGALPSASIALKKDLGIDNLQQGSLGSLVFFGLCFGSVFATIVMNTMSFKKIMSISFLGNGLGLVAFCMFRDFTVLGITRFVCGFFQIFLVIYLPLYIDTFGTTHTKSMWMSYILVAPPVGVVIGYGLTGVVIAYDLDWRISFFIQGVLMALSFFSVVYVPARYLNIDQVIVEQRKEISKRMK